MSSAAAAENLKVFDKERISLESLYYAYVGGTSGGPKPVGNLDLEANLRLQSVFSLSVLLSSFKDPDPSRPDQYQAFMRGYGVGMKIDLPGWFFLFATKSDGAREGKLYPVNTFVFGQILRYDYVDIPTNTKSVVSLPRYGAGMDVFFFNPYSYIEMRMALFNLLGSTYISPGIGVGINY